MSVVNLNYELKNENAEGPCIVLIHGLFGSLDNLAVLRRHFEMNYPVLSIDLPDHGKSERSESFSFQSYADSICALLNHLNLQKVVLVGHSLGGKVSMLVAARMQSKVQALVVMDIAPVKYSARHTAVLEGLKAVDLQNLTNRSQAKQHLSMYVQDTGTQAFLLKSLYQTDDNGWHWRFNLALLERDYQLLSDWPFSGELYKGPTLFIKGLESDYLLPEHQAIISQHFPNAKAKIVQAGHWLHAQKPQVVNAVITNFLRDENI